MANLDDRLDATTANAPPEYPIAIASPTEFTPLSDVDLIRSVALYAGQSVGEMYLGPGWLNDEGIACLIILAHESHIPKRVRRASQCAFLAWRWNNTPSTPFSVLLSIPQEVLRRTPRWMRASHDPVVQAIRRERRFLVTVANAHGEHSGWYEADFRKTPARGISHTAALDRIFEFPTPGIPFSSLHARFDPLNRKRFNDDSADEIPLWADPISDFWRLMAVKKAPWVKDLLPRDHAKAVWGLEGWERRYEAAGRVQALIDRQRIDGDSPCFDERGRLQRGSSLVYDLNGAVDAHPLIGQWLAALAGPSPDAHQAHEAVVATLRDPRALYVAINELMWKDFGDDALQFALHKTFIAGLLDTRITQQGTHRPFLATTAGQHAVELKTTPIDLDAPRDCIQTLWIRATTDWIELIDSHYYLRPSDFPTLIPHLQTTLDHVVLEGTLEDAEVRLHLLLLEAQEARQWSIPWGARVQLHFGPFDALRIFELDGEFRCAYLDQHERYFQVALNLGAHPPTAEANVVPKIGEPTQNEEAEIILKLIAAAIVRDFLVVEERESIFTSRRVHRRIGGRDIHTVVYLPRVRYSKPTWEALPLDTDVTKRARHHVAAHLRRSQNASAAQRFLALRYGLRLPQGFTFVRPHERGLAHEAERVRIYRSRSASRMIFEDLAVAPKGSRPEWFEFEKDCKRFLERRGLSLLHQAANRNGDGGVDLFATDRGGQTYVVQCKCWSGSHVVRPAVVRELAGAILLADADSTQKSRGILLTTGTFSTGAISAASELDIELIDGQQLAASFGVH